MAQVMVGDGAENVGRGPVPAWADANDIIECPDGALILPGTNHTADQRKAPPHFLERPFCDGILGQPDRGLGVDLGFRG